MDELSDQDWPSLQARIEAFEAENRAILSALAVLAQVASRHPPAMVQAYVAAIEAAEHAARDAHAPGETLEVLQEMRHRLNGSATSQSPPRL
jgi:hypothetical protein